jgi:hypothetical protein
MSVGVKVILLVGHDTTLYIPRRVRNFLGFLCMYTMVANVPTKRWTLTLPKLDEPFGVRFHFGRFLGTDVGQCEGRAFG